MSPGNTPLMAAYTSPDNKPFTITKPIEPSPPASASASAPAQKTAYLQALRSAVADTQEQINKELTARMGEDAARGSAQAGALGADEQKEEENYGEEAQDEE
ncbi:hypothetical protein E4U42_006237 [Claviceps africana]|uniref:EKC/KEOPS complex subunit GON7 n=1 Tax=Claviceps africana TaxID=83212 RepID=A0A8K0NGX2_9HYPO|nr:hypothetical protein E4U42_006237 [Claviceps africana]